MRKKHFISGSLKILTIVFVLHLLSCNTGRNENQTAKADNNTETTPENNTLVLLIPAASEGNLTKVKEALKNDVNVNQQDSDGRTALMYASFNGFNPVVKELLQRDANLDLTDTNGRSALMFAASGPFPETVKILLEKGAKTNIQDNEEHFTALMFAAAEGHLENVKILIDFGADPNLKDIDGDNALVFAGNNKHQDVVDFLKNLRK